MKVVSMGVSGGIVEVCVWLAKVFGCLFLVMGNVRHNIQIHGPNVNGYRCTYWFELGFES